MSGPKFQPVLADAGHRVAGPQGSKHDPLKRDDVAL